MRPPEEPPEPPQPPAQQPPDLEDLFGRFARELRDDWRSLARPAQIPPDDFSIFLELGGRGSGKTWSAAHYVCEQAASGAAMRIALIGATASDVRYTMVEGVSGVLASSRASERPEYEPGKQQLTWPSGCVARLYSADTPDALRGPEHDLAWCDELAAWRRADETWSNLLLTMRAGTRPRIIVTTTPRPTRLVRDLVSRDGADGIVVRRTSTYDNAKNLPPSFFQQLIRRFEGTRVARQELLAELLEDTPGALWNREVLEATRVDRAPEHLQRIVIGVDPAGSSAEGADLTGIVACAIGLDGEAYVLADLSRRGTPREWASAAIAAFHSLRADRVVCERNYGGEMCVATLASVDPAVPVSEVSSSRGKVLRAEPIASIFEQRRGHIVGSMPELEDQLCSFTADWNRARDGSPDRVDAMVFALTELMLTAAVAGFIREASLLVDGEPVPVPPRAQVVAVIGRSAAVGGGVGVVYVARCGLPGGAAAPLTILDWGVATEDASNAHGWLTGVAGRARALAAASDPSGSLEASVWCEPSAMGPMWLTEAQNERLPLMLMDAEQVPGDLDARALAARDWVTRGCLKLAREAYERRVTYHAVTANHLLAQLAAFEPGGKSGATELVAAFALAALITLPGAVSANVRPPPPPPAPPPRPLQAPQPGALPPGFHIVNGIGVHVPHPADSVTVDVSALFDDDW
jgi:phage terminase large subunit-like protein